VERTLGGAYGAVSVLVMVLSLSIDGVVADNGTLRLAADALLRST
jgi:hypothetical protein